ncbi:YybH family protein [Cupriavidus numazuensis]|uniref:DUF4440 domain-containing protein n=1 Tax=Cupriavidus numazuensis TaxID=221992 RepID=A0ABM8TM44_9BURK|nr:SgcJ/EcaC family oxidoreductase [Cupriavidus numazuensis]CAG2154565.1 hypothetical protein LMG26411_04652 [Cupriavidus numazuensis]
MNPADDERAIRELVEAWFTASQRGDTDTVLDLMTDDVVFMAPGQEPFGKAAFAQASAGMTGVKMQGSYDIRELQVVGDWAYLRNFIDLTITPPDGKAMHRSGYTLTLLRRGDDGRWRLSRDANLLAVSPPSAP